MYIPDEEGHVASGLVVGHEEEVEHLLDQRHLPRLLGEWVRVSPKLQICHQGVPTDYYEMIF